MLGEEGGRGGQKVVGELVGYLKQACTLSWEFALVESGQQSKTGQNRPKPKRVNHYGMLDHPFGSDSANTAFIY